MFSGSVKTTAIGRSWVMTTMPVASSRADKIALVDEPYARPPADRSLDRRPLEIGLGVIDLSLVEFDLGFVLTNRPFRGVGLLLRFGIRLYKVRISFLVLARIGQKRLILRLLRDGLVVGSLIESRVHYGKDVAFRRPGLLCTARRSADR